MHSCQYCVDSVPDLIRVANLLARVLARPQVIGQPAKAEARRAQYEGVLAEFSAINACVAWRSKEAATPQES